MSSTLDPENIANRPPIPPKGHDVRTLGPSDSSDSGSDMATSGSEDGDLLEAERGGDIGRDDDSDRYGTGENLSADHEEGLRVAGDIEIDRIVTSEEAGLGGGLDQAEEARLGVTDELLEAREASDEDDEDTVDPVIEKRAKPARKKRSK